MSASISGFYDGFVRRLLYDYIVGNKRAEAAITHAVEWTPEKATAILDIGCGVGWSTRTLVEHAPSAHATGLDLSPALIDAAKRLQGEDRLTFRVQDVTRWDLAPDERFDAITMLDVYEHIPAHARGEFHKAITGLLTDDGRLILTCPSPSHQALLREEFPDRLQPVDEDVTPDDFQRIAEDLSGVLVCCEPTTVWSEGDYTHAVISRCGASKRTSDVRLETRYARRRRVLDRLGVRPVGPDCAAPALGPGPAICVATFGDEFDDAARGHIHNLPGPVRTLSGPDLRRADRFDRLLPLSGERGMGRRIRKIVTPRVWDGMLARQGGAFLRGAGIEALLAENTTHPALAAAMAKRAGVKLILHFSEWSEAIARGMNGFPLPPGATVIATGRPIRSALLASGVPEDRIIIAAPGVNAGDESSIPAERAPAAIVLGPLDEASGCLTVVEAFAPVYAAHSDARLVLAGRGPLEQECLAAAQRLGIADAVQFAPPISSEALSDALLGARCAVRWSASGPESIGAATRTTLLAMSHGLPVIERQAPTTEEVVRNGETGILVSDEGAEALARALAELLADGSRAMNMGREALQYATEHHSLQAEIDGIVRIVKGGAG